jgi:hypothetical protein
MAMAGVLSEKDWDILLRRIDAGKCTPFLGAGACHGVLPLGADIAREWARDYDYPLDDPHDLARVSQYVAVDRDDPMFPKDELAARIRAIPPPNFAEPDEPHGVLADLPLPVYVTTNYDDFMLAALNARGKKPRRELCRWNSTVRRRFPTVFDRDYSPDPSNPVVFHLHGNVALPESLVLTEDDYLDFLRIVSQSQSVVSHSQDQSLRLLPERIEEAFSGATLLFLGYRISDWNFRVLYRSLVSYLEIATRRGNFSVQLLPVGDTASDAQRQKVQYYLDRFFDDLSSCFNP